MDAGDYRGVLNGGYMAGMVYKPSYGYDSRAEEPSGITEYYRRKLC